MNEPSDPHGDLIAGVMVCLDLLVRHLEQQGVIEPGAYRALLQSYKAKIPPARRDDNMYVPMAGLIEALGKPLSKPPPSARH